MKNLFALFALLISLTLTAQDNVYVKKGVAIEGYDVTEYFNNHALKGMAMYQTTYEGNKYYFVNEKNKSKFEANPSAYIPAYGGYCAYAIGEKSKKVSIDPETFELKDGKVYLFYNSWGTNTLDLWNENNPEELRKKADLNWEKLKK